MSSLKQMIAFARKPQINRNIKNSQGLEIQDEINRELIRVN